MRSGEDTSGVRKVISKMFSLPENERDSFGIYKSVHRNETRRDE